MGLDAGYLPLWHPVLKYHLPWGEREPHHCSALSSAPVVRPARLLTVPHPDPTVDSYGQEGLHYGNFGLVWFFVWVVGFFISTNFLRSTEFGYLDLVTHLIQISARTLTSPNHNTQHDLLERENGKCCMFIPSNHCNKPERRVALLDMRNCASIVKSWSCALC